MGGPKHVFNAQIALACGGLRLSRNKPINAKGLGFVLLGLNVFFLAFKDNYSEILKKSSEN